MSTKIKNYKADIKAVVTTGAIVRSSDSMEKVAEYVKNAFIQSMNGKEILVDEESFEVEINLLGEDINGTEE